MELIFVGMADSSEIGAISIAQMKPHIYTSPSFDALGDL